MIETGINLGQPIAPHPLNRGLTGWWLALPNWNCGYSWRDLCGKYPGTLTSMVPNWTGSANRKGGFGALSFDGTDDYVDIAYPAFASNQPVSVFAWIRPTSLVDFTGIVTAARGTTSFGNWILYLHGDGTIGTYLAGHRRTTATVSTSVWSHVGFSYDGSNINIFINGVSQLSAASVSYTGTSDTNISIGDFETLGTIGSDANLAGQADDVRLYNRYVPADEAYALYRDSLAGYPLTLNRLWLPVLANAPAGVSVTGDAAITFGAPAIAATATETFTGTLAEAIGSPAFALTGTETFTGTAAVEIGAPALAASGAETITGTAAIEIGPLELDLEGEHTIVDATGECDVTIAAPAIAADGTNSSAPPPSVVVPVGGGGPYSRHFQPKKKAEKPRQRPREPEKQLVISGTCAVKFGPPAIHATGAQEPGLAWIEDDEMLGVLMLV